MRIRAVAAESGFRAATFPQARSPATRRYRTWPALARRPDAARVMLAHKRDDVLRSPETHARFAASIPPSKRSFESQALRRRRPRALRK